jgi:phosphate transport system permease protein
MTTVVLPDTTGHDETPVVLPTAEDADDQPRRIRGLDLDGVASALGSALGSLGLVWVLFEQVLGWSGYPAFLLCWFVTFLGVYAAVSARGNPRPVVFSRLAGAVVGTAACLVGFALGTTVVYVFYKGWSAIRHLNFYTHDMAGVRPTSPLTDGGVLHAMVGTLLQVAIAVVIALPLGIGTAVYMSEVTSVLSKVVRTVVEAMTALADIIAGLFVYAVLIIWLGSERDGFAVAIALSVTMLPIIARSADVVLRLVPMGLREAGVALGASRWATVRRVVLPTARSGLATSLILGIARIAGETAPLLIVSGSTTFFNGNPFSEPMTSLPLYIYVAIRSGQPIYAARGYGAAALLLMLVLVLFVITRFLARDRKLGRS